MAGTYSQLNIHCVFAVKGREQFILNSFRDDLFKYMSGTLKNLNAFPLAVGGWKDHAHVFFELHPTSKICDLMRDLKAGSSTWINKNNLTKNKFNWQDGYSIFLFTFSKK